MKRWYNRRYFTLDDIKNSMGILVNNTGPFAMENAQESPEEFFQSLMQNCGYNIPFMQILSKYADTMWQRYLWPKYWNQYVCFTDNEDIPDDDAEKVFADNAGVIMAWLRSSDTKYSLLIKNMEDNKKNLLGQIKASSVSRFNDVPQNQGEFDDDSHNTTVTKSESSTDGGTLLSRLNEIEDNLKRLYDDWSNEFRQFIFWSIA